MAWNGSANQVGRSVPDRRTRGNAKTNAPYRGLLAGLIVVLGGGVAAWLFLGSPKTAEINDEDTAKSSRIVEVKPDVVTNVPVVAAETNAADMVTLPDGRRVKKPKTLVEAVALVPLKPGMHRYKSVDDFFAKTNEFQVGGYKPALFKHSVERSLGMIATRRRDMAMPPMPPLPPNAEQDFLNSLTYSMEVTEGEDPKDTETRMRVEEMKLAMKELMEKEGLTVQQAYRRIETEHNRLANMTQLYKGSYMKMKMSKSPDAEAFLKRANEDLRKAGACEFDENAKTINP